MQYESLTRNAKRSEAALAEAKYRRVALPPLAFPDPDTWRLGVDGLVQTPIALTLVELERLEQAEDHKSFLRVWSDAERESVWSGMDLSALFRLVNPLPRATCFYAHAPGFRALLPLDIAPHALLATRLNGNPLQVSRGGPCRLIVPESSGRLSVKWVERIELFRRRHEP